MGDPTEARCVQCNMLLACEADLTQHVRTAHTCAARRGTRAHTLAREKVYQHFQDNLPKVQLRGGFELRNVYKKKWVGMTFTADGGQDSHVRERLMWAEIEFGRQRGILSSRRTLLPIKISAYKGAVLINATYGCETITLTSLAVRRYINFNVRCLATITGRTFGAERTKPTFDVMAWIYWRRAQWLGKALRGEKGDLVLNAVHWGFQHQERGDIFNDLPPSMKVSFLVLCNYAQDAKVWSDYCKDIKPKKWVLHADNVGGVPRRRSQRVANRSNERARSREALRRQLVGRHVTRRPEPGDVSEGEVHVYTDGSASIRQGRWGAGSGVWFGDGSDLNISAIPPGRQTNNRAELTAIILAVRKAMSWPAEFSLLVVFSDSRLCVDGLNKWMDQWEAEGWNRLGNPLENADLWRVMRRALTAFKQVKLQVRFRYVPTHVGIYGNERADRLAKAAAKRAHLAAARTVEQRQDQALDALADSIVATIISR